MPFGWCTSRCPCHMGGAQAGVHAIWVVHKQVSMPYGRCTSRCPCHMGGAQAGVHAIWVVHKQVSMIWVVHKQVSMSYRWCTSRCPCHGWCTSRCPCHGWCTSRCPCHMGGAQAGVHAIWVVHKQVSMPYGWCTSRCPCHGWCTSRGVHAIWVVHKQRCPRHMGGAQAEVSLVSTQQRGPSAARDSLKHDEARRAPSAWHVVHDA